MPAPPIGQAIREAREMRGLTREQLAARCGVPARTLAAYETTGVEPSWHRVVEIARALRISLEALAGRDPVVDAPPEAVAAVERLRDGLREQARAVDDLSRALGA